MVERKPSKLKTRVRFPSPAPHSLNPPAPAAPTARVAQWQSVPLVRERSPVQSWPWAPVPHIPISKTPSKFQPPPPSRFPNHPPTPPTHPPPPTRPISHSKPPTTPPTRPIYSLQATNHPRPPARFPTPSRQPPRPPARFTRSKPPTTPPTRPIYSPDSRIRIPTDSHPIPVRFPHPNFQPDFPIQSPPDQQGEAAQWPRKNLSATSPT